MKRIFNKHKLNTILRRNLKLRKVIKLGKDPLSLIDKS